MPAQPRAIATAEAVAIMRVERIAAREAFEQLEDEWSALSMESAPNNYFQSFGWAKCWWNAYGGESELFVLMCRMDDGLLVGIAPLYREMLKDEAGMSARALRLIGDDSDDADGFGLLARQGRESECVNAVLDWLQANASEWDLLELRSMPEESRCTRELFVQIRERGWVEQMVWSPQLIVELPKTWEGYLASLSAKTRQTWLRKIRRVEGEFALNMRRSETAAEVERDVEISIALHQKSWRSRGLEGKLDVKERQAFYRGITGAAFDTGNLDLWILELNGVARAARLGFCMGETRHAVIAGMDPEFAHYGVGTITEALVLKRCIESGIRIYDFLAGEDAYKLECGATHRRYMNLRVARPRTRAALLISATDSLREGKQWLRTRMPSTYRMLKEAKGR